MDFKKAQQLLSLLVLSLLCVFNANAKLDEQQRLQNDRQLFSQAVNYSTLGQWEKAEPIYRDLLTRYKDWPEPRNNLAVLLLNTNRVDEARLMLEQAVISLPSFRISQNNRTQLYNYLASKAYDKALGVEESRSLPQMQLIEDIHLPVQVIEKTVEVIVEKPVEVKPVITAVETNDYQQLNGQISEQLSNWVRAWSEGDVDNYLQAYHSGFQPEDNTKSFEEWKNIRRARLRFSKNVDVSFDGLKVFLDGAGNRALVEFKQNYHSSSYQDRVLKQLFMQKDQEKWLILSERVIKTY